MVGNCLIGFEVAVLLLVALASLPRFLIGALLLLFLALITARRGVLITRDGAWGQIRFFGMTLRSYPLGHRPRVEDAGFDWHEVALIPADESLRHRLHDEERFVLLSWDSGMLAREDPPGARHEAGNAIARRLRDEISRLHSVVFTKKEEATGC